MSTPAQPPAADPRSSNVEVQESLRHLLAYLRGVDGWLLLGAWIGMFASSLLMLARSQQQLANGEAPVRSDDPLFLLYKGVALFTVICGLLFGLRLLRLLPPWWTRVFPALALVSFALTFLYFPLFTAVDTPLSRALFDAFLPMDAVLFACGMLGVLSVAVGLALRPDVKRQ